MTWMTKPALRAFVIVTATPVLNLRLGLLQNFVPALIEAVYSRSEVLLANGR